MPCGPATVSTTSEAPAVICLLGTSRSGSTLLQRALELHSEAIALGEMLRVNRLAAEGRLCSCGSEIAVCSFWAPVLAHLDGADPPPAWGQASAWDRLNFMRTVAAVVTGISALAAGSERRAAGSLARALTAFRGGARSSVFIESSKDPTQFLRLALGGTRRLVPVHVVRDPRGVAWSAFKRTVAEPETMAKHWLRLNALISWLRWATPQFPWQVVRYEDFCRNPAQAAERILAAAGVAPVRSLQPKPSHAVGGSPGFALETLDSVDLDERWRIEMPEQMQQTVMATVGSSASRLGYS